MTETEWNAFCQYKQNLKKLCDELLQFKDELFALENKTKDSEYPLENCVVYNTSYDDFSKDDEIKLIVVGDNPGQKEQLEINKKYLVGLSGKIANKFYLEHPEFNIDFYKNVIITNKTPIHTARTVLLKKLYLESSKNLKMMIDESQIQMAKMTAELHKAFGKNCFLHLIGYSELKKNGIFSLYKKTLEDCYKNDGLWQNVLVFQHYSMNRFTIDLNSFIKETGNDAKTALHLLGKKHRAEIFDLE